MDVIWRRGFKQHYSSIDGIIRPYSDLEEEQIRRAVQMAQNFDMRYTLEQSLPMKTFLDRNPDMLPVVQCLVSDGHIELPGGGEALVDLNMVCGESLVRNHFYSILWCEKTFGTRPLTANGADQFGYCAQYPQLLRLFGYETLANSSRLFDDEIPFWRGLDGSMVLVRPSWQNMGLPQVFLPGGCVYPPSPCCEGEGCTICGYTGLDLSDENIQTDETLTKLFDEMSSIETGPIVLRITGEENLWNEAALRRMVAIACDHGFKPRFVTMTESVNSTDGDRLKRLREGNINQDEIQPKIEANPICTGCYVSRIRIKQWNRRLEALLLAAETLAAFAYQPGGVYPRAKLERLWNQMALLQFHDAITGSHTDGAYEELISLCRNIARDTHQIYEASARAIGGRISAPEMEGYQAAAVFNSLPWTLAGSPVDIVLDIPHGISAHSVEILDVLKNKIPVTSFELVRNAVGGKAKVRLLGLEIPPHGYTTIHYRFTEVPVTIECLKENVIENEYYRVTFDNRGAASILDKELGEEIMQSGAGGLLFEEDYGSVWETLAKPSFSCLVADYSTPTLTLTGNGDTQQVVIEGKFADRRIQHDRYISYINWRQEITLYSNVKRIYIKTTVDWDTSNGRLMLQFPLSFRTPEDETYYEIPFGVLPRKRYKGEFGLHTRPNGDWPALNFVTCHNEEKGYWVTITNKGTPCHRVEDGVVKMTVLRSPCIPLAATDTKGAWEVGTHVFEVMISSAAGSIQDVNPVRLGMEFNTPFIATPIGSDIEQTLPPVYSFLSQDNPAVVISAVKRAEDGDDLIVRLYEPYGQDVQTVFPDIEKRNLSETDLLELNLRQSSDMVLRPYEIKTVRIKKLKD